MKHSKFSEEQIAYPGNFDAVRLIEALEEFRVTDRAAAAPAGRGHRVSTTLGTTILMVEQNIREAFKIVQRVYVLKLGRIVFEDAPDVLLGDDRMRKAYLG